MDTYLRRETQIPGVDVIGDRIAPLIMLCVLLISPLSDLFAEPDVENQTVWSEYRHEDGIRGYERSLPGTKYIETRSVTIIDKPIDLLWGILKDIESYPEWMYRCTDAQLISQKDDLNRVLYFSQGVSFGSPDRQVITQAITTRGDEQDSYSVRVISLDHEKYNLNSDLNRADRQWMNEFRGKWVLQGLDDGSSKVSYTAFTDPGGFAPGFIVNRVIRNVTFNSLAGMIKRSRELNAISIYHDDELINPASIHNASSEKSLD